MAIEEGVTKVQTTVRLPEPLYRRLKQLLAERLVQQETLNDLAVAALEEVSRAVAEKGLDAEFAGMSTDENYAKQCRILAGEFATSDWEALPKRMRREGKRRATR
jgi:hypothetical protein